MPEMEFPRRRRRWSSSRAGLLGGLLAGLLATRNFSNSQARAVAFAEAAPGHKQKWLFLLLFGLVDIGQAFVIDWAEGRTSQGGVGKRYVRQSVLVIEPFLAIIVGLAVQGSSGGFDAVWECLDRHKFLEFIPVCLFFGVGMSMKMRAVGYFNAGTIKIFGQLRLPLVALVSTYLLSRHYSREQWQAITAVAVSCFFFMWCKEQQGRRTKDSNDQLDVRGLLLLAGWILLNVLGGVFAERAYKSGDKPFFSKKVSEDFGYLLLNFAMLFVMPCFDAEENVFDRQRRPGCLFDSWDRRTVAIVVMLMLDATASNWLLQEFSALTKSIMKAFCVAIIYFMSLTYADKQSSSSSSCRLNCSALMVVGSSLAYARVASSH